MIANQKAVFDKARLTWGDVAQLNMVQEECAELIKECSKAIRNGGKPVDMSALAEEIADVELMCAQVKNMFGLERVVNTIKAKKVKKLCTKLSTGCA